MGMEAECITGAFYHMNVLNVYRQSWGEEREDREGESSEQSVLSICPRARVLNIRKEKWILLIKIDAKNYYVSKF